MRSTLKQQLSAVLVADLIDNSVAVLYGGTRIQSTLREGRPRSSKLEETQTGEIIRVFVRRRRKRGCPLRGHPRFGDRIVAWRESGSNALVSGARLSSADLRSDNAAGDNDFNTPVCLAPFCGVVVGYRVAGAITLRGELARVKALGDKEIEHSLGALFGELLIEISTSGGVGVPTDGELQGRVVEDNSGQPGERYLCCRA